MKYPPGLGELVRGEPYVGGHSSMVWNGRSWTTVKNLGWLLSHRKDVESLQAVKLNSKSLDALLIAFVRDDKVYATTYADRSVLAGWLARPVFMGVPLNWFGEKTVVSKRLR